MNQENQIYNQLSSSYDDLFIQNISYFRKAAANKNGNKYAVFYPSFGIKNTEKCDFLIYGQAIKGWQPEFGLKGEPVYKKLLNDSIEYSNSFYQKEEHCPLDWVNVNWSKKTYEKLVTTKECQQFYPPVEYSTSRSFFWNVTYKLICRYYGLDENGRDWVRKIVWSNLYKIAPTERENPGDDECSWQKETSIGLVQKEIEEIKPRYCIVLTNDSWWEPFRKKFGRNKLNRFNNGKYIESVEQFENFEPLIIVTKRPYVGNSDAFASEILKIIGNKE